VSKLLKLAVLAAVVAVIAALVGNSHGVKRFLEIRGM